MKAFEITMLTLALAGSLAAQGKPDGRTGRQEERAAKHQKMDVNGDGRISRDEWKGPAEAFNRIDADGDGALTGAELAQAMPGRGVKRGRAGMNPPAMDTNRDGRISRDEWNGSAEAFNRIDANGDGYLTTDEAPKARRGPGAALAQMDANHDGSISREEWKGRSETFDRIDADKDGYIEQEEAGALRRHKQ
jgi:Ca2+-binding EF-hand superfamily protein